ncbi:hypothetical protein MRX96_041624 [Rhipicephalus microplus]
MASNQGTPRASVGRVALRMSPAIRIHASDAQPLQEQPLSLLPRIINWPSRSELEGEDVSRPVVQDGRAAVATEGPIQAVKVTASPLEGEAKRRRAKSNRTKPFNKANCDQFSFIYCAGGGAQRHYYDWTIGSCVPTPHAGPLLCNRGRNRFTSLEHCRRSCMARKTPSRQCSMPASFTVCSRRDMKHELWFWDGNSCVEWNFHRGNCMKGQELTSKTACLETCKPPSANDTREVAVPSACRAARSAPCSPAKMRFPFFAAQKRGGDGFECVEASAERLQRQLCLAPGNTFASIEECDAACKRGGSEKK